MSDKVVPGYPLNGYSPRKTTEELSGGSSKRARVTSPPRGRGGAGGEAPTSMYGISVSGGGSRRETERERVKRLLGEDWEPVGQ